MAGSTYNKTEQEKANELFDYQPRNDHDSIGLAEVHSDVRIIPHATAEVALREIFDFYANAYALLKSNQLNTFDQIHQQRNIMDFQAFLLFCRQFRLVTQIFSTDSIRIIFKKHSNFGKSLTFEDFVNIVRSMAHEKEAVAGLGGPMEQLVNREAADQSELQNIFNYLGLGEPEKYKARFKPIVEAFESSGKVEPTRIRTYVRNLAYKYRKMSQPQLLSKALRSRRPSEVTPATTANKHFQSEKQLKLPAQNQNIVSWQALHQRLPSLEKLTKVRNLVRQEQEDQIYLQEYSDRKKQRTDNLKDDIRKRIDLLTKNDEQRHRRLLDKVNQRIAANELL